MLELENLSHSPQGECGLKSNRVGQLHHLAGHSPQGECGLKYPKNETGIPTLEVTPRKGSVD